MAQGSILGHANAENQLRAWGGNVPALNLNAPNVQDAPACLAGVLRVTRLNQRGGVVDQF